jgi:type IV pilus assembly protein PilV
MMALAVLAIGATGVISLQKATLLSTLASRNLTSASVVAASWVERAKTEAAVWNSNPIPAAATLLTAAQASTNGTVWQTIPGGGGSRVDGTRNTTQVIYCSQIRGVLLGDAQTDTFRFEVRTVFAREGRTIDGECDGTVGGGLTAVVAANPERYGIVTFTGTIKRNTL